MGKLKVGTLVIVMIICVLIVISCAFGEAAITVPFGNVEDFIYENEYLGIGCQFEGWHFYNVDELKKVNSFDMDPWPQDIRSFIYLGRTYGRRTLLL